MLQSCGCEFDKKRLGTPIMVHSLADIVDRYDMIRIDSKLLYY